MHISCCCQLPFFWCLNLISKAVALIAKYSGFEDSYGLSVTQGLGVER